MRESAVAVLFGATQKPTQCSLDGATFGSKVLVLLVG